MGRLYDKKRWHRVRARKLARDVVCEGCGEKPSAHVDHITPLDDGGKPYDVANMQSLCAACHNAKTAANKAGKRWIRPLHLGCHADGSPRDPQHPWGVPSLQPVG